MVLNFKYNIEEKIIKFSFHDMWTKEIQYETDFDFETAKEITNDLTELLKRISDDSWKTKRT